MAINISHRNFHKDTRNCKRNQEILSDETALRDEILELKRQVMVLRRTNEQNLVKFRKYEDEAKRKDREIEELMDPRKNADVTKVLSTKGAAILMTLKDQNNALIQMVLNKDVQIKRLMAEMRMSKLYGSTRKTVSYKEEIARLKNLLIKSQEKLKENLDKENEAKLMSAKENSFLEFSSSGQSSPRELDELRLVIRNLEAHIKYSIDLLNKKDKEISVLNRELTFMKKLLQHKTSKNKNFDCHPTEVHKYSINDTHSVSQARVSDIILQSTKISGAELLEFFEKPSDVENKNMSSSAPASSTRLPLSNDFLTKHKSLSNITSNETSKDVKVESVKEASVGTSLQEITLREDSNKANISCGKVRERKKILTKHRESKKRITRKFSGNAKKQRFYDREKRTKNVLMLEINESNKEEETENSHMTSGKSTVIYSKENEMKIETPEILKDENGELKDGSTLETELEESAGIHKESSNLVANPCDVEKKQQILKSVDDSNKNKTLSDVSGGSSEIIRSYFPMNMDNSKTCDEDPKSINFRREIYRQSFDSSFESENGYPMKEQVQQVQVEVQIDSILIQNDGDESENFIWENSHPEEFTETKGGNFAPDDNDDNNDDDTDVIIR